MENNLRHPLKDVIINQEFGKDFTWYNPVKGVNELFYKDTYGLKGHPGIDYKASIGTPIYAMHDGKVLYTGYDDTNGNLIQIWNEEKGFKTMYGHNSEFKVKTGDKVKAGDLISLSGNTGAGTGPHLHMGLKMTGQGGNGLNNNNGYNGAIDPMPFIKQDYLGNNLKEDMIFQKEKTSPNVYLINKEFGTKIMVVDLPTLDAFHGKIEEVDSLAQYIPFGTMVWTERIIN